MPIIIMIMLCERLGPLCEAGLIMMLMMMMMMRMMTYDVSDDDDV